MGFGDGCQLSWSDNEAQLLLGGVAWNDTPADYLSKLIYLHGDVEVTLELPTLQQPDVFTEPKYTSKLFIIAAAAFSSDAGQMA